jgi:hypothetical protein
MYSSFQHFSISAFQHFSISAFQHFSISAFQHFSISAFRLDGKPTFPPVNPLLIVEGATVLR